MGQSGDKLRQVVPSVLWASMSLPDAVTQPPERQPWGSGLKPPACISASAVFLPLPAGTALGAETSSWEAGAVIINKI